MSKTFRLVVAYDCLAFPHGGVNLETNRYNDFDTPCLLVRLYDTGDRDSIPWPMPESERDELLKRLAYALFDERACNPYFPSAAIVELPDGTEFDFESIVASNPRTHEEDRVDPRLTMYLAANPLDPDLSLDPASADPVIREMYRLSTLIEADQALTAVRREELNLRLLIELNAYEAWQRQYASYFREPRRWTPPDAPVSSGTLPFSEIFLSLPLEQRPSIHIFADFGGFTHREKFPVVDSLPRKSGPSLVPHEVHEYMNEWTREFHKFGWDDFCSKPGSMLWVAFDMRGVSIARAVKRYVGEAARVVYSKPDEDPFCRYERFREFRSTLEVVIHERCPV